MTPPQTPQTSTAADRKLTKAEVASLVNEIKRFVEAELPEDEHDHTATWVYEAAIYVVSQRLAAASAERESALRAENEELKGDLDLRTQERDGAMRAAVRQFNTLAAKDAEIAALTKALQGNALTAVSAAQAGAVALTAERQKGQALREWLDMEIARVGRTGRGTWEHGVVNGAKAVRSKMRALGLAPAPTTGDRP